MSHTLLIDGENISSRHAAFILGLVPPETAVRRVYGDAARLNGWLAVPDLCAVHVPPARNAADIALAVAATSLAYTTNTRHFTLVTSDGGLAALAWHLREIGREVTLVGGAKTPAPLRAAAHSFVELPVEAKPLPDVPKLPPVESLVLSLVEESGSQGIPVASINAKVWNALGIKVSTLPEKTWNNWLAKRPDLFKADPRGPAARVRCAPQSA
jgi:NYN domain